MTDEKLLNAVFRFKHKAPSVSQDEETCKALATRFAAFVASLEGVDVRGYTCSRQDPLADDRVVPVATFAAHEVDVLQGVCRRMLTRPGDRHSRWDVWFDPWLPMYGCAIQRTVVNAAVVKLDMLFVDGWERTLHFLSTGECVHSSVPKSHRLFHCVDLKTVLTAKFRDAFASTLHEAQQCERSRRSAATSELGHQKTPQFVAAVVRRAVASITGTADQSNSLPKGGTTDVGQHTGGQPRDTCWALVQAAIAQNLCCGQGLFRNVMVMFQLSLLRSAVRNAERVFNCGVVDVKKGCDLVDDLFFMLQTVVQGAVELFECGYDVEAVQEQCAVLKSTMEEFVDKLNCQTAMIYRLPDSRTLQKLHRTKCDLEIVSPEKFKDSKGDDSSENRRLRALTNLSGCEFIDVNTCSLAELLQWVKSGAVGKHNLILRTVETFMFSSSLQLSNSGNDDDGEFDLEHMQALVTEYQRACGKWRQLPRKASVLAVEQRSREMLVVWIAFYLVHQECAVEIPLCREYNIALKWTDLKVAVLSDRAAISALQNVAQYIREWNCKTLGPSLFHLSEQAPTFDFARAYGLSSDGMKALYDRDVDCWEAHMKSKWRQIEAKKSEAVQLRDEIRRQQQLLHLKQSELNDEVERLRLLHPNAYNYGSRLRRQLKGQVNQIRVGIERTQSALANTLTVPSYPVRPLPPSKADALQVIFMLRMPRSFEILGNLCLSAQRALAPAEITSEMATQTRVSSTTWAEFYSERAPSRAFDDSATIFTYAEECIWDPTFTGSTMTWKDSAGACVNPFNASCTSIIDAFVEKLPDAFGHFQWMNSWPGDDNTRGNVMYANLYQKPEEFEKTSFIALGSLRAFPNQQFRKLQCAMLDDTLPWSNPFVEIIVRQSLYQVGDLTDEPEPKLLWKTDMFQSKKGVETFCMTLKSIADKLEQTPRSFECVPLLSKLAGYAHQFTNDALPIVKTFARMTRRWAENEKKSRQVFAVDTSSRRIAEARQKECVLYGYALLAYMLGPWDDEIAQNVCELIVLFRNSLFCASVNLPATEKMCLVESNVEEMMSRRTTDLVAYVRQRGIDFVLTGLVRLVSETSPSNLTWSEFGDVSEDRAMFGSCFEAEDPETDTHYSINLFTGSVLTDGYTPGGLPTAIREHKRFRALFNSCNFEVFFRNGVHRTERKWFDRLYDFALHADGDLVVQELSTNTSGAITSTLQLCSERWIEKFSRMFPSRLRELYSHWHWMEQKCVLLRPKTANDREVFFVAKFDKTGLMKCYKVPLSERKCSYEEILRRLPDYDRFIQRDEPLLSVLSVLKKFEYEQFLHSLKSPEGVVKIEMPRYKLTFLLNDKLEFASVEHKGYILSNEQQFNDFLPRFNRYLVLELQDKSDTSRPELRLLLPVGNVVELSCGMVDIQIPTEDESNIDIACFDEHRRLKVFETETISARLQLAAVCACSGTNVPSKRLLRTGAEMALQMLRACRSSRPYSEIERDTLLSICRLSYREPTVKIMAMAILADADRLGFLFGQTQPMNTDSMQCADEKTEYADICTEIIQRNPLRRRFRSDEERLIFGRMEHFPLCVSAQNVVSLDPPPVGNDYVKGIEVELSSFVRDSNTIQTEAPPLPLDSSTDSATSKSMLDELQLSWECHHSQAQLELKASPDELLASFTALLAQVSSLRCEMEQYLWGCFTKATGSKRDRLLVLGNFVPTLTMSDIVRSAFDEETLHTLVPTLSATAREEFKGYVYQFMELCVLEDKMERIVRLTKHSAGLSDAQLVKELINTRRWNSAEFPYWLAFEVEGKLQIRHEQFVIAHHLINQPGSVCQLNMGCGKTRVILPMLFLHFMRSSCTRVVRAHFLSPLLSEARQFLHRFLSASNARLGVFEQPFHRQVALDIGKIELIRDTLQELKIFGGIQIVAPEHRMSLELKHLELDCDDPTVDTLDEILDKDQYVNVLDECDALLHHKYHVVYAVGDPADLCCGIERWQAAEALLRIIASKDPNSRVRSVLFAPCVSCMAPDYATRLGAFAGTRLNAVTGSSELLRQQLKEALVLDLIDNAPFEFMWLNTFGLEIARDSLVRAITDARVGLEEALGDHFKKFAPFKSQLLALRGLIAFGVLEHCMEKRYRVDFGLPFSGSRPKKIAIPFRAADVPSDRSEFSHPDVCIVLTLLGYYHNGLTDEEVGNTFRMLLRLDISEQRQKYSQWYASVEGGLDSEDQKTLCDVRHISLSDARQFASLCRVFKFCMEAINFYLNTCVFPKDTQQYPQRLSRTAWNLAAGDSNIGFSGTNDNHRLLPLSVRQQEPNDPSLLGTNGKMIDKILQVTQGYEVIRPSSETFAIPWQSILLYAVDKGAQALIDTGALLAGVANHNAAQFLLQQPDFGFAGVTYYDTRQAFNCWVIVEKHRRLVMPLKSASIQEKETFVIFDEARSRGSDMKLPHEASALLTLGPKLTKDKLMQGAGRMRQLGCNQTLWIASFDEVAQSVLQSSKKGETSGLTAIDVLNWVIDNTKAESVRGLLEWASNGIHYRKTQMHRDAELVDEDWSLETLYQDKLHVDTIARIIQSKASLVFEEGLDDSFVAQICSRGCAYGLSDEVCVTSHTDEGERGLQVEEEVQHERELEVAQYLPAREQAWNYAAVLRARSVQDVEDAVPVLDVQSYVLSLMSSKELAALKWSAARMFMTENFASTIVSRTKISSVTEFVRVIDALLVFDNGQVLLLSECEADHILSLLWSRAQPSVRFVNFAFARESIGRVGAGAKFRDIHLALGSSLGGNLPLVATTASLVFNGETMLAKQQQEAVAPVFRELLGPLVSREATLSNFVKSRGNSHKWTRSFLHELCCRMDLEDCK
ncbi:hypothetical protein PF011_g18002 [Phytophthora fragariae]|uniref:ubiquitinyl hydrolase 1 n=1 Tax=Phytophthora fragariae TaxID=53985 RepID=A0A6A3J9Q1_9STRA|nr:hypothetical protein PF011_g18002 [Phytophthora fragariae]